MHLCKQTAADPRAASQEDEPEMSGHCEIIYAVIHGGYNQPCGRRFRSESAQTEAVALPTEMQWGSEYGITGI